MLIYSRNKTQKLRNLASDHLAGFHLAGDGRGGDNVILEGTLQLSPARPSAAENGEYLVKYGDMIEARGWTPASFARDYSSPLDFRPTRARIW
jgi:PPOX class probable F420-dependent enzyme